jgi:hypothetical protein
MSGKQTAGVATYLFEMGLLKHAKRTGWWIAGIKDPETIAEHSFRTALIGAMLAAMEGADPARTALLCLFHDTQETRTGDIPHIGRRYLSAAGNESVTADQVATCPPEVAATIRDPSRRRRRIQRHTRLAVIGSAGGRHRAGMGTGHRERRDCFTRRRGWIGLHQQHAQRRRQQRHSHGVRT